MVDTCHAYYASLWGRGQLQAADALLDPHVVHRDLCGAWLAHVGHPHAGGPGGHPATGLTVGPRGIKALVADVRQQYPDMYVQVRGLVYGVPELPYVMVVDGGPTWLRGRSVVASTGVPLPPTARFAG